MSNPTSVVLEDLLLSQVKTANYKKATVLPFCNREYEGQLKEKGDTINVIIHPNVTGTTSGASGDDIPESQYQPTKVPLTV